MRATSSKVIPRQMAKVNYNFSGIEVGHIFQLDRAYSEPMSAFVLDQDGRDTAPIMGCYGMGVTVWLLP